MEGAAWRVQEFLHVKPGKGPAFVRSKLKNLETGAVLDKTWKAGESFPDAQVDKEEMQFSVRAQNALCLRPEHAIHLHTFATLAYSILMVTSIAS